MSSAFDINVSAFKNSFDALGVADIPLISFLTSERYRDKIEHLRTLSGTEKSDFKRKHLPCITPSCTCTPRTEKGVKQHSGFIQFDIDSQDNTMVTDWPAARDFIGHIPEVAYCALSSSGHGAWGLVQIKYPEKHREHFAALEEGFMKNGYKIDPSCKNITRLRYYSWDPEAIIKFDAPALSRYIDKPKYKSNFQKQHGATGDRRRVEAAIEQIVTNKIDITTNYKDWWQMGAAFIAAFGEQDALKYFHAISQFHPKYDPQETQEQFDALLSHDYEMELSIFFARCRDHGIDLKKFVAGCKVNEAGEGADIGAAPTSGNLTMEEDAFVQHIRELAQDETTVRSLLSIVEQPTAEEIRAMAENAEKHGAGEYTLEEKQSIGQYFENINPSYRGLIEAFALDFGEPVSLTEVPF